jgi:serine/threonine protein kinase
MPRDWQCSDLLRAMGKKTKSRYELKEKLGEGGMGVVWRAFYTVDDVIDFYDRGATSRKLFRRPKGNRPLHLLLNEKQELKEFLKTALGEDLQDIHNP